MEGEFALPELNLYERLRMKYFIQVLHMLQRQNKSFAVLNYNFMSR